MPMTPVKRNAPNGISATESIRPPSGKLHCVHRYSFGKERPRSPLHIAQGILKGIWDTVDGNPAVYGVAHAVNAVPALHKGEKPEGPHDVIPDFREGTKL